MGRTLVAKILKTELLRGIIALVLFLLGIGAIVLVAAGVFWVFCSSEAHVQPVAMNLTGIRVYTLPDGGVVDNDIGPSGSLILPVGDVALIPSVGFEVSPQTHRWGFTATLIADKPISDHVGLDVNIAVIHDQAGLEWKEALIFAGAGGGVSIYFGKLTVSPFVNIFRGVNISGWSLVPGVNLAWTL